MAAAQRLAAVVLKYRDEYFAEVLLLFCASYVLCGPDRRTHDLTRRQPADLCDPGLDLPDHPQRRAVRLLAGAAADVHGVCGARGVHL